MIALDTNVLARLILRDNPAEYATALAFLGEHECSVGWSVLVELCWVLERSARLPRDEVAIGLSMLNRLANLAVPDPDGFEWAIERFVQGADFADMIHLISGASTAEGFATFDRKLARQAGATMPTEVLTLRGTSE